MAWGGHTSARNRAPLPGDWAARRQRVLARDHHMCRIAGPTCIGRATTVDHTRPVATGGSHEESNLQAACVPCHQVKSSAEAAAARHRFRERRPIERHPGML